MSNPVAIVQARALEPIDVQYIDSSYEPIRKIKLNLKQDRPDKRTFNPLNRILHVYSVSNSLDEDVDVSVEIDISGNAIITMPDFNNRPGSTFKAEEELSIDKMRQTVHELTFRAVSKKPSDAPLESILPLKKQTDRWTPDYIFRNDANSSYSFSVLECTTNRGYQLNPIVRAVVSKLQKYTQPLLERQVGKSIRYEVIGVSNSFLVSTFELEPSIVLEFHKRFLIANKVASHLESLGYTQSSDSNVNNAQIETLMNYLESDSFNFNEAGEFSKKLYETCLSDIDGKHVDTLIHKVWKESNDKVLENIKHQKEPQKKFMKDFCSYKEKILGTREDQKSVGNMPFISVSKSYFPSSSVDVPLIISYLTNCPIDSLASLWIRILSEMEECESTVKKFQERPIEILVSEASTSECIGEKKNPHRSKFNRVVCPFMSEKQKIDYAKVGVNAKKLKDNEEVKRYREDKKKGFKYSTYTNDIDKFIMSPNDVLEDDVGKASNVNNVEELVRESLKFCTTSQTKSRLPEKTLDSLELFCKSNFMNFTNLVTLIAAELAISLKHNSEEDEFEIKKIRDYPVYLLIKTTRGGSHIFYSLLIPKDKIELHIDKPFRSLIDAGECYLTDFCSYNENKLDHLLTLFSTSIGFWGLVRKMYEIQPEEDLTDEAWRMMKIFLLIFLDNKHQTEEVFTLFRYMGMQGFVESPLCPLPSKVIDSFPKHIKSRLELWAIKKLVSYCEIMNGVKFQPHRISLEDKKTQSVSWSGMINPYTGSIITNPAVLIEIFYLGYIKNKSEKNEGNKDFLIVKKILEEEFEYWEDKERTNNIIGSHDKEEYLKHDYSPSFVKKIARKMKEDLMIRLGADYEKKIERDLCQILLNTTGENFHTLKASSRHTPETETLKDAKELSKKRRKRVCEAFSEHVDDLDIPILNYRKLVREVESSGMRIDIFAKEQHGGTREIYVLRIFERALQLIIETISRYFCSFFPSETMTHPENKINIPVRYGASIKSFINHSKEVTDKMNNEELFMFDLNDSKDKKRWNNTNSPSKFIILLCNLLPKKFHPLVFNILKLWDNKKILLPPGIISIFERHPFLETEDKHLGELLKSARGQITPMNNIYKQNGAYLTIKTGMMQGILHYTSSLFHCAYNNFITTECKTLIIQSKLFSKSWLRHMESSDDSSFMRTYLVENKNLTSAKLFSATLSYFVADTGNYLGMYESYKKSTLHTNRMLEFNSEFIINGQLHKPTIKFVLACFTMSEAESLIERQIEMSNLLSSQMESGTPTLQGLISQYGQAHLHYLMLGNGVSPIFPYYKRKIMTIKDPGTGFFLMDEPLLSGILGFEFNYWKLCTLTNYNYYLKELISKQDIQTTSVGMFAKSAIIYFGNRSIWRKMEAAMENVTNFDWRKYIEDNPDCLFLKKDEKYHRLTKMLVKVHDPSVVSSLSRDNRLCKIFSSSVYVLSEPVISSNGLWQEFRADSKKISLYKAVIDMENMVDIDLNFLELASNSDKSSINNIFQQHAENGLSLDEVLKLFPHHSSYISILENLYSLKIMETVPWTNFQKKRTIIEIKPRFFQSISLKDLCIYKWFGVRTNYIPESMMENAWKDAQVSYHWLRDDLASTLEASRFENLLSLSNFIMKGLDTGRKMRITAAPLKQNVGDNKLELYGSRVCWPGYRLVKNIRSENVKISRGDLIEESSIYHVIYCAQTLPINSKTKLEILDEFIGEQYLRRKRLPNPEEIKMYSERFKTLWPILAYKFKDRLKLNDSGCLSQLEKCKNQLIGFWSKRAYYNSDTNKFEGQAIWLGQIDDLRLRLHLDGGSLVQVDCNDGRLLMQNIGALMKWVFKNKLDIRETRTEMNQLCFNGLVCSTAVECGAPVTVDVNITRIRDSLAQSNENVDIQFRKGSLRLLYDDKGVTSRSLSTLCRFNTRLGDYKRNLTNIMPQQPKAGKLFIKNFIEDKPLGSDFTYKKKINVKTNTLQGKLKLTAEKLKMLKTREEVDCLLEDMQKSCENLGVFELRPFFIKTLTLQKSILLTEPDYIPPESANEGVTFLLNNSVQLVSDFERAETAKDQNVKGLDSKVHKAIEEGILMNLKNDFRKSIMIIRLFKNGKIRIEEKRHLEGRETDEMIPAIVIVTKDDGLYDIYIDPPKYVEKLIENTVTSEVLEADFAQNRSSMLTTMNTITRFEKLSESEKERSIMTSSIKGFFTKVFRRSFISEMPNLSLEDKIFYGVEEKEHDISFNESEAESNYERMVLLGDWTEAFEKVKADDVEIEDSHLEYLNVEDVEEHFNLKDIDYADKARIPMNTNMFMPFLNQLLIDFGQPRLQRLKAGYHPKNMEASTVEVLKFFLDTNLVLDPNDDIEDETNIPTQDLEDWMITN